MTHKSGTCHGLGCTSTKLIKAHIIGISFARDIRAGGSVNILEITPERTHEPKHQLGQFDSDILCKKCDGILGEFEDYGSEICRNFGRDHVKIGNSDFELRNFDGDRFAKSVLAILWKASISKRPISEAVALGPYEDKARDVLFGAKSLNALPYLLFVQRYQSDKTDPTQFYFYPVRYKTGVYGLGLAGFKLTATFGNKGYLIPGRSSRDLSQLAVNGKNVLRGTYIKLETDPDIHKLARQMRRTQNPL